MACHLVAACVPRRAVLAYSASRDKQSGFMELLASTPIGQPESDAERRIREAAEWVVDNTESRAQEGNPCNYVQLLPN
ncbi:hypothetical protein TRIUR3_05088 [Triticum urartu]|uniref:Uncharacterized protein n=1 Tax=Triticum urartu TaxID=4572 RepID=M7YM27_TRIUA|nr:hypothetical protein TRIUR3_05088 [Triticum urartu]